MGAAISRLRSIAPAAKAIGVASLLFVAGAVGMIHQSNTSLAIGNWTSSLDIKLPPGEALRSGVEPSRGTSGCSSRRRRPRRLLPLPHGILQVRTDLEMEKSLAGNPERQKQVTPPKSLLAIPVGIKNKDIVNRIVTKFPATEFSIMLFHYDGVVEQWHDLEWSSRAVHVVAEGQTKWWFAKRFLHPDIVSSYEYIFLWDEDVEVDAFDPLKFLEVVKREGLHVSQPALDRRSEIHHAITARALMPTSDAHRRVQDVRCGGDSSGPPCTGWVELMVPVFSQAAWRCAWHLVQNDLIHGWGLDYKLGYCAQGDRTRNVGVVDSEYVLHRGVPMLRDGGKSTMSSGRGAVRWRSFKEMQIFNKRWNQAAAEDKTWTDPYAAGPSTASST